MRSKILFKIYFIWFFRRIVPLMVLQAIIFGLALKFFANKVFVANVLVNAGIAANSSYIEFFKYLLGAFFQARLLVQTTILIVLGVGSLILRDVGRAIVAYIRTHLKNRAIDKII